LSDQYYIRVRGRVQGPFDVDKLRQLARRGQFSRLHEISVDGQQWEPAKDRPELFAAPTVAVAATTGQAAAYGGAAIEAYASSAKEGQSRAAPNVPSGDGWYYVYAGKEQGPVDFTSLYEMFVSRHLAPDTEIWRQGMAEWAPAHAVPGFFGNTAASSSSIKESGASAEVGTNVIRVLVESRGWVLFIAVITFIYAAMLFIGGLLIIVIGPRVAADTAMGLFQMLFSVIVACGAWMLISYAAGVENFHRRRDETSLAAALLTLKSFWTYVGIVLIVLLTVAVIGIIMILSMAGSLSGFMTRFS
jgi:hypothetical protein